MRYEDIYNPPKLFTPYEARRREKEDMPEDTGQIQIPETAWSSGTKPIMPTLTASTTQEKRPEQTQEVNMASSENRESEGGGTAPFYSPELENLKHAFLTHNWFAGSPYKSLFENIMNQLSQPVNLPIGLTATEQQELINRARANIAAQTQAQLANLANLAGGRGFRFGESGRTDTVATQIARAAQQQLGEVISNLMIDEARRRFEQNLAAQQFNLARLSAIPEFAQLLESADINRLRTGLEALQIGGSLEQFIKQFQAQEAAAAAAQALREKQFEYQQQMDALKLLYGLYQSELESQLNQYSPFWRAILSSI